jgi:hypothetical protein
MSAPENQISYDHELEPFNLSLRLYQISTSIAARRSRPV